VMMCILPEDASDDVTLHIHFTLIEAFCWENDIRVVKVQFESKLQKFSGIISIIICLPICSSYSVSI